MATLTAAVAAQIMIALATYALAEGLSIGLTTLECILIMQPIAILIALDLDGRLGCAQSRHGLIPRRKCSRMP